LRLRFYLFQRFFVENNQKSIQNFYFHEQFIKGENVLKFYLESYIIKMTKEISNLIFNFLVGFNFEKSCIASKVFEAKEENHGNN